MISINTNTASSAAAYNLANTNVNLQKSLNRLSSGFRINSAADDAGGLAVSMKMSAAIRRTDAASSNVGNALSFLQTQDGVLKNADKILNRMSELATLALDVTKTSADRGLYDTEFQDLLAAINDMTSEQFNGQALFSGGTTLAVRVSEDGTQTVGVTQADLNQDVFQAITGDLTTLANATDAAGEVTTAIDALATLRATNGSQQSRLSYAADMLALNKQNLEAANSRIIDVDVAKESAQLARFSILQQAGTAMLAQANQSTQSILRLLS
ncbi:MAG: flagellin [Verrucomicrobiota bacterium]